jgi:proteasome lid subunit RPN8/RPN11
VSGDDIVFEEMTYREPRRVRRPDFDHRFACLAYEVPGPDDLAIFLDYKTADAVERHALRDTSVELGGILLGMECVDELTGRPFVWITQSLEAKHYENTEASFTYTHDAWEEITRERDRLFPELDIVGWYHTHPDFGIFLSGHDQFLHRNFFGQPLQVAYVIDPIRQTRGFFRWRQDVTEQVGGFYLTAERGDRPALAKFVNDLENYPPSAGSGGGGLSPRLEAELIAMLTRPHAPPASTTDRAQTAAVFTLLGVALGVLALSAVLWLNTLVRQVQDQSEAIKGLEAALTKSEKGRAMEVAAARVEAKEVALDRLLSEVRAGGATERFSALYTRAQQDLDEARAGLKEQRVNYEAVFAVNDRLKADLAKEQKKSGELAEKAKKVDKLVAQVDDLNEQIKRRDEQIADHAIFRKYDWAWYSAIAGGVVSVLLFLGLVASMARTMPAEPAGEEPPHTIT